jgi:hypothetical protein
MSRSVLTLVLLIAACSSAPIVVPRAGSIHPQFATLRPVMVAVRIEATTPNAADLDAAVRHELLERNYSPLAPGVEPDAEAGMLLVIATRERASVAFTTPEGTLIYRMDSDADPNDPPALAKALLASLPPK